MDFSQVAAEFQRLKAQYDADTLSEADFKARLQDLMVQDDEGRWWMIGAETEQWYVHDGEKWVQSELPHSQQLAVIHPATSAASPDRAGAMPGEQKAGQRKPRWLWAIISIMAIVAVIVVYAIIKSREVPVKPEVAATVAASPAAHPGAEETRQPVESALVATEASEPAAPVLPTNTPELPAEAQPSVLRALSAPSCSYGGALKAIEALDDLTVRFTLCYADVGFPAKVALPPFGIHPAEYLIATGGTGQLLERPIGTGPYRFGSWNKGSTLAMSANLDYWGKPAEIPKIEFHWNPDANARLFFLKEGNIEGFDNPAPQAYTAIQANADLRLHLREGLNTSYLGISSLTKPFDDPRVRRGVALAIDRDTLASQVYPPGTTVAAHFTPCSITNGCAGEAWYTRDPEMAQQLLFEAGYPDGFETELVFRDEAHSYLPDPAQTAQALADMLAESLGLRVALKAMGTTEFSEAAAAGTLPLYLSGWSSDCPDPANFLSHNYGEFSGPRFEAEFPEIWEAIHDAARTAAPNVRAELYTRANDLIKRDVPVVPLAHVGSAAAFRTGVTGAHSSPLNLEHFAAMSLKDDPSLIWKQATEPRSLYCADEVKPDTWRACAQITESLLAFQVGSADVIPALAESYEWSEDLKTWTFYLRKGVTFHDGSRLDATDVVMSWVVQWDAGSPFHRGRTGEFAHFKALFEKFLNAPK